MTSEIEYQCNNCGHEGLNTRVVPDVPELVRYGNYIDNRMHVKPTGEYVRYDQAAEIIAAKDNLICGLNDELQFMREAAKENRQRAEEAEAERDATRDDRFDGLWRFWNGKARELSQRNVALESELVKIKALLKDHNAVHIALLRGDIAKPTAKQINHVYAAPVDQTAEIERLKREVTRLALENLALVDAYEIMDKETK